MKRNVKNGVVFMLVMMMAAGVFAPGGAGLTEEVYGAEKATNTKSMKRIQGNWTDYAAKRFASGDGTRARPYRIESRAQLALLSKIVNESGETSDGYTKFH